MVWAFPFAGVRACPIAGAGAGEATFNHLFIFTSSEQDLDIQVFWGEGINSLNPPG